MKKIVLVIAALALLLITTTGFATSAHAASYAVKPANALVSCSGSGCNGKDPNNSGCWDNSAYIVHGVSVAYGAVYLWYSPTCGTNWSEAYQPNSSYIANANITRSDGLSYSATSYSYAVLSPMVYSPVQTANACGSINNAVGGCTGYW